MFHIKIDINYIFNKIINLNIYMQVKNAKVRENINFMNSLSPKIFLIVVKIYYVFKTHLIPTFTNK